MQSVSLLRILYSESCLHFPLSISTELDVLSAFHCHILFRVGVIAIRALCDLVTVTHDLSTIKIHHIFCITHLFHLTTIPSYNCCYIQL